MDLDFTVFLEEMVMPRNSFNSETGKIAGKWAHIIGRAHEFGSGNEARAAGYKGFRALIAKRKAAALARKRKLRK